ncbi:hypothetical protein L2Y94_03245 [Luteibacter aegosomatis]|uniref:hypothetical protein n=1 Tax=Luteibacter aegosomatis TaxID=2911537 RepID=UPI001FFB4886|nr:hypothetical protein [Luteibacter aegosomatis]UPG86389.1 hypothetical protein L2Y94_03245 [Luteibacter aegosomatis]
MSEESVRRELAGPLYGQEPWPLRFHTHGFAFRCYNTLQCSAIYNRYQFGTRKWHVGIPYDGPAGPPSAEDERSEWNCLHAIPALGGKTFPGPVEIEWTSLDGDEHATSVDLDALFKDRLVLHAVPRHEVKESWLKGVPIEPVIPNILVEVNDRTVSVHMQALIVTEVENETGLRVSRIRSDAVLARSVTY